MSRFTLTFSCRYLTETQNEYENRPLFLTASDIKALRSLQYSKTQTHVKKKSFQIESFIWLSLFIWCYINRVAPVSQDIYLVTIIVFSAEVHRVCLSLRVWDDTPTVHVCVYKVPVFIHWAILMRQQCSKFCVIHTEICTQFNSIKYVQLFCDRSVKSIQINK